MKILFSIPYAPTFDIPTGTHGDDNVACLKRDSDWGKTGLRKKWCHIEAGWNVAQAARGFDVLVLCTVGIEAFIVARLRNLLCPRTRIVVVDILLPAESGVLRIVSPWLSSVDLFACIRTGDIATLNRRFGIPAAKCFFVPFPANCVVAGGDCAHNTGEAPYIYSAGAAHRDWQTLIAALKMLDYRAILSPGFDFKAPDALPERIKILPPQPPEDGRQLLRKAQLAVLSLKDTDLPSGPLVLLDAMSMGKPVIASRVNGTLDYIIDGETGILVSPNNPSALAEEIRRLMEDPELAIRIGDEARTAAMHKFTNKKFIDTIMAKCGLFASVPLQI